MNALPATTIRRLQKIPQLPTVWEGDRRVLPPMGSPLEQNYRGNGECIVWVDGTERLVRAMDVVTPETGPEAVVRTLLRAMENPHSPASPARPQKIIVKDREIQFFLRGALQNLDITIDYVPDLPLINELFQTMESKNNVSELSIAPKYESKLREMAAAIWDQAPWEIIADYEMISLEIEGSEIGKIYACIRGMIGGEYGIILYRSLTSLKQFQYSLIQADTEEIESLEQLFLGQDCWFLNYDLENYLEEEEEEEEEEDIWEIPGAEIPPIFGSIHPLEGIRAFLEDEEAITIYTALLALLQFIQEFQDELNVEEMPALTKNYQLPALGEEKDKAMVTVKVSTLPELTSELLSMLEEVDDDDDDDDGYIQELNIPIKEDLIPEGAFLSLGMITQELFKKLRNNPTKIYQSSLEKPPEIVGELLPVILIQTTRPKAKLLIETIQEAGGIKAICFNEGEDLDADTIYDLGIVQTGDGNLHIFGQFVSDDPNHISTKQKWEKQCEKNNGNSGLIVAMGVTGANSGNPQLRDIMALFEATVCDPEELGMGILQLGWDLDSDE